MGYNPKDRKVVITGIGVITPVGIGKDSFWESTSTGKSGISTISRFNTDNYPTKIAGEIKDFVPEKYMPDELAGSLCRSAQLGLSATQMAIQDANLDLSSLSKDKIGVSIGVGAETLVYYSEKIAIENKDYAIRSKPPTEYRNVSNVISEYLELSGPNLVVATACSSGNQAIGIARDMIKLGQVDHALTGGVESPYFSA